MTLEERMAPIVKAINDAFADDPTLDEGITMLKRLRRDITIMLVMAETKARTVSVDDVLARIDTRTRQ